jgi:hypothetical protein
MRTDYLFTTVAINCTGHTSDKTGSTELELELSPSSVRRS